MAWILSLLEPYHKHSNFNSKTIDCTVSITAKVGTRFPSESPGTSRCGTHDPGPVVSASPCGRAQGDSCPGSDGSDSGDWPLHFPRAGSQRESSSHGRGGSGAGAASTWPRRPAVRPCRGAGASHAMWPQPSELSSGTHTEGRLLGTEPDASKPDTSRAKQRCRETQGGERGPEQEATFSVAVGGQHRGSLKPRS